MDRRTVQVDAPAEEVLGRQARVGALQVRGDVAPEIVLQRGDDRELRLQLDLLRAGGDGGETEHAFVHDGVQRAVDENADAALGRAVEHGTVHGRPVVLLESRARLDEVHRKLEHAKVVTAPGRGLRDREHARQRDELGVVGGPRARVGGDAVRADPARRDLALEPGEGLLQPPVELLAPPLQLALAALVGVAEVVLRVVEEAHVQGVEPQARERARELVGQEVRAHAVPDPVAVLDHLGEGPVLGLPAQGHLEVGALHVADLGDDDDLLAAQAVLPDEVGQHLADERLAPSVRVVGGGIDEVAPGEDGAAQRFAMLRCLVVDAVAAEADATADEAGLPQRPVPGCAGPLPSRVGGGGLGRGRPREA